MELFFKVPILGLFELTEGHIPIILFKEGTVKLIVKF